MAVQREVLRPLFDWRAAVASPAGPESPTTRHVLLTLSLHMSVRGDSCFPSVAALVAETGLSERAVRKHLALAEAGGWLQVTRDQLDGKTGISSNLYLAAFPQAFNFGDTRWNEGASCG